MIGPLLVLLLVTPSSCSEVCTEGTPITTGTALLQSRSNFTLALAGGEAVSGWKAALAHLRHKNVQLLQEMLGQPSERSEDERSHLAALLLEAEFLSLTNISLFYAICTVIAAIVYRETFKWPAASQSDSSTAGNMETWKDDALDYSNNAEICCWAMCCCPVRYADNISHVGILGFWNTLALILTLNCLSIFVPSWIATLCLCTYWRQLLRQKFNMPNCTKQTILGDCLWYCCCPSLAVAQEARHLHAAALVGHPAIVLASEGCGSKLF